jgi:signal peptidase I
VIAWRPALPTETPPGLPPFEDERQQTSPARLAVEIPLLIVLAAVIAFLLKTFIAQAFYIPSVSMVPQLHVNDRVVVSKLAYRAHEPRRGDIVVFDDPTGGATASPGIIAKILEGVGVKQPSTEEYIKRVIALPGEQVQGRDGRVYVNDQLVEEPYLPDGILTSPFGPVTVPEGRLWVMGDNRTNSTDSRGFGTIDVETVVGRAILKVWPLPDASFL